MPPSGADFSSIGSGREVQELPESRESLGAKFLKKLRREFSAPLIAEQAPSPRLRGVRSADDDRKGGAAGALQSYQMHPHQLGPMASRRSSMLFAKNRRGRRVAEDGALKQLPSEDSLASDGELSPQRSIVSPGSNDSSRQLNILWEDDPGSKSNMFLSLLNIENAN